MFNKIGLRVGTFLGALLFAPISVTVGWAKAHPAKHGPAVRHSQFLCLSGGLPLFRISEGGMLVHIPINFADNLPLPQSNSINELLPDLQGHSIYVLWNMTYNQGATVVPEVDRMRVSQQGKLFSAFHQAFPLNKIDNGPRCLALGKSGKFLLIVFNKGLFSKSSLQIYRVQPHGPLRPVARPVLLPSNFQSITVDPAGRYAYIIDAQDSRVYQYCILPSGIITPIAVPIVRTAIQPTSITFHPSGNFAYIISQKQDSIALYRKKQNGALNPVANYVLGKSKNAPTLAVTPNGRFLYTCFPEGKIFQYRVSADGVLHLLSQKAVYSGGYKLLVDSTNRFAYALSNTTGANVIYQYRIRPDGTLQPLVPQRVTGVGTSSSMAIIQD